MWFNHLMATLFGCTGQYSKPLLYAYFGSSLKDYIIQVLQFYSCFPLRIWLSLAGNDIQVVFTTLCRGP